MPARPLDEQRINGVTYAQFIDYATVALGLYGAASNTAAPALLLMENVYAATFSKYAPYTVKDVTFPYLPETNVFNTKLGYSLYQNHAFGPCRKASASYTVAIASLSGKAFREDVFSIANHGDVGGKSTVTWLSNSSALITSERSDIGLQKSSSGPLKISYSTK